MRRFMIAFATLVVVINFPFSSTVLAQEEGKQADTRVIEETLILKDPTVTSSGKWVVGGALEYWYIKSKYDKYDNGVKISDGDITGSEPGGNIFVGYGDFTVNYAYRKGSWDVTNTYTSGATTNETQEQKENEITVRWLMRGLATKFFTPYILAGYSQIDFDDTETLPSTWVWTYNGGQVKKYTTQYKSPLLGLGVIIPLNSTVGFRVDGRALYSQAEYKLDNGYTVSGSGVGFAGTATMYVNVYEGLNLQFGGKYQWLNGGDAGSRGIGGVFAMLGYSYK